MRTRGLVDREQLMPTVVDVLPEPISYKENGYNVVVFANALLADGSTVPHIFTRERQTGFSASYLDNLNTHSFQAIRGDCEIYDKAVDNFFPFYGLRQAIAKRRMVNAAISALPGAAKH